MSSYDPTVKRKSRFDVETTDINNFSTSISSINQQINPNINISVLQQLGFSGAISNDNGGYFIPATDPAFSKRIEKALIKNYDYIISKDTNQIKNKSIYEPNTNTSAIISKFDKAYKSNNKVVSIANGQSITKTGVGIVNQQISNNIKAHESTSVYISGLPNDITEDEIDAVFNIIGKIKKIKLYVNSSTGLKKGDGLVTFSAPEFVKTAVSQFNNLDIGDGYIMKVSRADFNNINSVEENNDNNQNSMQSIGKSSMEYSKYNDIIPIEKNIARNKYQLAASLPIECQIEKYPVVLLQNVYDPILLPEKCKEQNISINDYFMELQADFLVECCQFGTIIRLVAQSNETTSIQGCVAITFSDLNSAENCYNTLNNRKFDDRIIKAIILTKDDLSVIEPISNNINDNVIDDNNINIMENSNLDNSNEDDVDVDDFLNSLL